MIDSLSSTRNPRRNKEAFLETHHHQSIDEVTIDSCLCVCTYSCPLCELSIDKKDATNDNNDDIYDDNDDCD